MSQFLEEKYCTHTIHGLVESSIPNWFSPEFVHPPELCVYCSIWAFLDLTNGIYQFQAKHEFHSKQPTTGKKHQQGPAVNDCSKVTNKRCNTN